VILPEKGGGKRFKRGDTSAREEALVHQNMAYISSLTRACADARSISTDFSSFIRLLSNGLKISLSFGS
jgi:hypothetical protein